MAYIRTKKESIHMLLPSHVYNTDWLWAYRNREIKGCALKMPTYGKWMLFPQVGQVDQVSMAIKRMTEEGLLGYAAKVATMKPSAEAHNEEEKLICVYTYDGDDTQDLLRVLKAIRSSYQERALYKEDIL